jgi:hypothetical protein
VVSQVDELGRELRMTATESRPPSGVVPGDNRRVEESPEQVLARLARYRDSLNRAPGSPVAVWGAADRAAAEPVAASSRVRRYSPGRELSMTLSTVQTTLVGHLLAVLGCTFAVFAFEHSSSSVAAGVVLAATAMGLFALARRVPLAVWWTLGVVIGGALGLWS